MKAVVLEVRRGVAAVLKEDGTVEKLRRVCQVGETIEVRDGTGAVHTGLRRWLPAAAAAVAAIVLLGGVRGYLTAQAYSYVTLDVNPSLEYTLNRMNRVLSVSALNQDAVPVVDALNQEGIRDSTLSAALTETLEVLAQESYLDSDTDYLLVSVSSGSDDKVSGLTQEVQTAVRQRDDGRLRLCTVTASREDRAAAQSCGLSTGRYAMMKDIQTRENGDQTASSAQESQSYQSMSVPQLLQRAGKASPGDNGEAQSQPAREQETQQETSPAAAPAQRAPAVSSGTEEKKTPASSAQGADRARNTAPAQSGTSSQTEAQTPASSQKDNAQGQETQGETSAEDETAAPPADRENASSGQEKQTQGGAASAHPDAEGNEGTTKADSRNAALENRQTGQPASEAPAAGAAGQNSP